MGSLEQTVYAILISFIIGVILCPIMIPLLHKLKFGQNVRDDGPETHLQKQGTPTMGGISFLIAFVVTGVFLEAIGVYGPIADWGGAGATVPLTGFGSNLAKGVAKAVGEKGWLGVMTGGLTAAAGGIAAAVLFSFLAALVFRPGEKR